MIRIVFPTNQRHSYISPVEGSFDESDFLTILNVRGQNITAVETIRNPHLNSEDGLVKACKENKFSVLISPNGKCLPLEKLEKNGVSVYKTKKKEKVLNIFSDFVQDKLKKVS